MSRRKFPSVPNRERGKGKKRAKKRHPISNETKNKEDVRLL